MNWFKHDSNAHRDAKLKKVIIKYGLSGYGLYWFLLEEIANGISETKFTFEIESDAEIISHDTGISIQMVSEMMAYMVDLKLFENSAGTITCLKMLNRLDSSMTSNQHMRNIISRAKSAKNHDGVMTNHDGVMTLSRTEESRVEESTVEKKREEERTVKEKKPVPAKKKKPQEIVEIEYPAELNKQAWREWIDHRKQAKMKKLTPKGEVLAMKNLVAMGDHETQRAIIEQSMSQGWTGLFLLKGEKPSQKNKRDNIMAFVYGDGNGRREEKIIEGEAYETE